MTMDRLPTPFLLPGMNAFLRSLVLGMVVGITRVLSGSSTPTPNPTDGFPFVTFRGQEGPLDEQIYFALSKDGRNWAAVNDSKPVLVSQLGEKGVRDPYILRSHDGKKFYLIATDLSWARDRSVSRAIRAGSRSIVIWESRDLTHWSEPRLVAVAPEDAGCAWAPEAVYDKEDGDYMVFWASTTKRDNFARHRIWAARTKDFKNFGEPFIYIDKPVTTIDTTIIHDGRSYYRFTKDEAFKAVTLETSSKLTGPWTNVPDFSLAKLRGHEGPQCYIVEPASSGKPATWCLILDHYQAKGGGYRPVVIHDLAGGEFAPGEGFTFPFKFRHGSVLPLASSEYRRLQAVYANSAHAN
jgi:sucrose-6-phosphate hydrolase SacC (GH32 family)